jgi:ASC-1-like (ASCH) protein
LEKGVEIYTSFPGYAQKEKEFGVVAIRFKIIL